MESDAYETFAKLEDLHFWFVSRRRIIFRLMDKMLAGRNNLAMLEVGCGAGGMLGGLARYGEVHGLDVAHEYVEYCQQRGFKKVLTASGYELPFPHDTFDVVALFDTIEHLPDDERAMSEVQRVLRPGGMVILSVPAYQFLFSQNDRIAHHYRRYTAGGLKRIMRSAGLQVVRTSYFNMFLFPVILSVVMVQKLREKLGLLPPDRHNMSKVPIEPANKLLTWVMSSERWLIPVVRLPFGHSLIGLGRCP